ncbi:MAG TPA: hypothetical protein VFY10_10685 [Dehalococcoidia bacterium]|nr:hypothetical protein [Dehalococcoidia bacterium]
MAILLTLVVACGDKSTAAPTASPAVDGAGASPTTGMHAFTSSSKGYSIEYPSDWKAQENAFAIGGYQADAFLGPALSGFSTNVNVLCDPYGAGMTADDYLNASDAQFEKLGIKPKTSGDVAVGTGKGKLITWTSSVFNQNLDYAQILVTDAKCGWVLTLTTLSGGRDQYMPTFLDMSKSFMPE